MTKILTVLLASTFVLCIPQSDAEALNSAKNSTRLSDMPLELLLNIYENLDRSSLTSVAKTNPINWAAAEYVYRNKYAIETFDGQSKQIFHGIPYDNCNNTDDFNGMLNSIEMFGHLITKLHINYYYFNGEQRELLNQYLKNYTTDSLIEISLNNFHENDLIILANNFKNVETLRLASGNVSSIDLSEIFPAVRNLDATFILRSLPEIFERNFLHLEKIVVEFSLPMDLAAFERRLRLNPQLRHVSTWNCNWPGLRLMSEILPDLETLDFIRITEEPAFEGDDIHLENLKALSTAFPEMQTTPVVLGGLENITCYGPSNRCFDLIIQNRNLKKIVSAEFTENQLQRMAEELTHLEDFTGDYRLNDGRDIDNVVRFIETSQSLRRVAFWKSDSNVCDDVIARLPNWRYVFEDDSFAFVVFYRNESAEN